jgi:hypothetical protein
MNSLLAAWPLGDVPGAWIWIIPALALLVLIGVGLLYACAAPKKSKGEPRAPWDPPPPDGANLMRIVIIAIGFLLLVLCLYLVGQTDGHSRVNP